MQAFAARAVLQPGLKMAEGMEILALAGNPVSLEAGVFLLINQGSVGYKAPYLKGTLEKKDCNIEQF